MTCFVFSSQAVVVKLCIDDSETRALGIDCHVCELQVVLRCCDEAQVRTSAAP